MTDGPATSPALTARQRAAFAPCENAEAERRLNGSLRMLGQIIDGDLDNHIGEFLDSEQPPPNSGGCGRRRELIILALFGRRASDCTKAGVITKVDEDVANERAVWF